MTQIVEGSQTLDEGVQALMDGAIADYTRWSTASISHIYNMGHRNGVDLTPEQAESRTRQCKEQTEEDIAAYTNSIHAKAGRRYIKVIQGDGYQTDVSACFIAGTAVAPRRPHPVSVHCFIVATSDDEKFKLGDVLMAEGWSRPARNKARGNVFTGVEIQWTGALYL